MIDTDTGFAIDTVGAATTITSAGTIIGGVDLTDNADVMTISAGGTWDARASTSDFRLGADVVTNAGTILAGGGTVFNGLETFSSSGLLNMTGGLFSLPDATSFTNSGTILAISGAATILTPATVQNSGTIDLLGRRVGDVLTINSAFVGSGGSTLAIDFSDDYRRPAGDHRRGQRLDRGQRQLPRRRPDQPRRGAGRRHRQQHRRAPSSWDRVTGVEPARRHQPGPGRSGLLPGLGAERIGVRSAGDPGPRHVAVVPERGRSLRRDPQAGDDGRAGASGATSTTARTSTAMTTTSSSTAFEFDVDNELETKRYGVQLGVDYGFGGKPASA